MISIEPLKGTPAILQLALCISWINVGLCFLVYGIPCIYEKRILFLPGVMWAKFRVTPHAAMNAPCSPG